MMRVIFFHHGYRDRQDHSEYKKGGGGENIQARARVPLYTGGVHEPALGPLPGAQGAESPEALEFEQIRACDLIVSSNKN